MELLSVDLARAVWVGPVMDLNPKGIALDKLLVPFLLDTYKFKKIPDLKAVDPSKGFSFERGEFTLPGEDYPIAITFGMFDFGFTADSRSSTRNSEAFLIDVFSRFSQICKIPPYDSFLRRRGYVSRLFVHTEKSIELLNPKLTQLADYLSENVEGGSISFHAKSLSIWPDQTVKVPPLAFSFEPVLGTSFSENRYFSAAPLQTEKHLELLKMLEEILS